MKETSEEVKPTHCSSDIFIKEIHRRLNFVSGRPDLQRVLRNWEKRPSETRCVQGISVREDGKGRRSHGSGPQLQSASQRGLQASSDTLTRGRPQASRCPEDETTGREGLVTMELFTASPGAAVVFTNMPCAVYLPQSDTPQGQQPVPSPEGLTATSCKAPTE